MLGQHAAFSFETVRLLFACIDKGTALLVLSRQLPPPLPQTLSYTIHQIKRQSAQSEAPTVLLETALCQMIADSNHSIRPQKLCYNTCET